MKNIISLSGGKDSTAMLHLMLEKNEPIHSVIFFDTGWEFPQMIDHIHQVEKKTSIKVNIIKPEKSFDYWMFQRPIIKKGTKDVHRIGNGWPSPMRRWCTRLKANALDKHFKKQGSDIVKCIGFAYDEKHRLDSKNVKESKIKLRFPLIEYGMTEKQAHAYCRVLGYDWGGLYDRFDRVSCFCCPLQRIGELRKLRKIYPELWGRMLKMGKSVPCHNRGFRMYDTVHDLEKRFEREDLQNSLFELEDYEKKEEDYNYKCGSFCERK